MTKKRTSYKERASQYEQQRDKLAKDLVDFALEWKRLVEHVSIPYKALGNAILMDEMATLVLKTYTDLMNDKETEEKDS